MITLDFPAPPPLNQLWRSGKNRKTGKTVVYKNRIYEKWLWEFWLAWYESKPANFEIIQGRFDAEILVCPKRKRDADASAKAVLDAAEKHGLICNDSQCRRVVQELVSEDRAPRGCRLTITPL
jgi:Holliday junction resolvase RusA-like endonuclease